MDWLSSMLFTFRSPEQQVRDGLLTVHRARDARHERNTNRRRGRTTRQTRRVQDLEQEVEELKSYVAALTRLMVQKGTFESDEVAELIQVIDDGIAGRENGPAVQVDGVEQGGGRS